MDAGITYKPTTDEKKQVWNYLCAGCTQEDIAMRLDMCVETLQKHFPQEIKCAKMDLLAKAIAVVEAKLLKGDLKAAQFVLTHRGGWFAAIAKSDTKSEVQTVLEMLQSGKLKVDE